MAGEHHVTPLDDRRVRLLRHVAREFDAQPPLFDLTSGNAFYPRLRVELLAAGATSEDFEILTEQLVRMLIEGGIEARVCMSQAAEQQQLDLIGKLFALRELIVKVEAGKVVSVTLL